MFIDIHCHLDLCDGLTGLISRARANNVGIILNQGVNPHSNRISLELSNKYPEVKSSLGLYPLDALAMSDEEIKKEQEFIAGNKENITAIGEIGMDFKESSDKLKQETIFRDILSLSLKINKPVIIHSRKAEKECIEILEKLGLKKVIMHCFCGKWSLIQRIIKNSWYLTVPTNVKSSRHFQRIAKEVPLSNLFCETDSPFLHPDKKPGNEPSLVLESYKKIAELRNISLDKVEKTLYHNFKGLLKA